MHGHDFAIVAGRRAGNLAKAIQAAEAEGETLIIEPGKYTLDEPVHVLFDQHHTEGWGVWAYGAAFTATFPDPVPVVTLEAIGGTQLRCFALDGLAIRAANRQQKPLVLAAYGTGPAIYRFQINRPALQGGDDGLELAGNVFEGDINQPWCSDGNCGLALGHPRQGGIISAINVWGGSLSQNGSDGLRTWADEAYQEPYDFSLYGTYLGNNGRYSINAAAGVHLLKGVRVENPWCDIATHDPDGKHEHACIRMMNYATLEQVVGGGNGNGTCLVDGYLSGHPLTMRECSIYSSVGRAVKLAKLDGQPGAAFCHAIASPQEIKATANVRLTQSA